MSEIRRERLKAVGVLVLIGAVFAGWMATRERAAAAQPRQSQALPDGSTLHLERVLGGKDIVFDTQTKMEKLRSDWPIVRPFTEDREYYRESFAFLREGEQLVALLSLSGTTRHISSLNYGYEFADGEGWRQHINVRRYIHPQGNRGSGSPLPVLLAIETAAFPHNRKTLFLRVLNQESRHGAKEITRFEIVNPVYRLTGTGAAASPLPVSVRDGDLQVTLHRLAAGLGEDGFRAAAKRGDDLLTRSLQKPRDDEETGTYAVFQLRENDRVTTGWGLASLQVISAGGCIFTNRSLNTRASGDYTCFFFQPDLWTGDGPFRLKGEFVRSADFPEEELWTVSFPVPASTTTEPVTMVGLEKAIGPGRVILEEVAGPKGVFRDGGNWWNNAGVRFTVDLPAGAPYRLEKIDARDEMGRRIRGGSSRSGDWAPRKSVTFSLDRPWKNRETQWPVSTTITMTLALTRTRTVELNVEPESVGEEKTGQSEAGVTKAGK